MFSLANSKLSVLLYNNKFSIETFVENKSKENFKLKETRNSYFLCNPSNSVTSEVCITFPQMTQKILTKDAIHWLELINEILSFLQILSVRKTTTQHFNILENLQEIQQKTIFLAYFGPLKANYR